LLALGLSHLIKSTVGIELLISAIKALVILVLVLNLTAVLLWIERKGAALIPSSKKRGGMGTTLNIPLGHKDAAFVRSQPSAPQLQSGTRPAARERFGQGTQILDDDASAIDL